MEKKREEKIPKVYTSQVRKYGAANMMDPEEVIGRK